MYMTLAKGFKSSPLLFGYSHIRAYIVWSSDIPSAHYRDKFRTADYQLVRKDSFIFLQGVLSSGKTATSKKERRMCLTLPFNFCSVLNQ